jgi:hypothetical protein
MEAGCSHARDHSDVVIHIDITRAGEPLEKWSRHELDLLEAYPTAVRGVAGERL